MPETTSGLWDASDVYRRIATSTWVSATPEQLTIAASPGPSATVSTYSGYIVFKFTSSGTLTVGNGNPGPADAYLVQGGNAGQDGQPTAGGNGGNGGSATANPATTISANTPIPVVVGGAATHSTFGPLSSSGGPASGTGGTSGSNSGAATNGAFGPPNSYETGSAQYYAGGGGGGGGGLSFPSGNSGVAGGGPGGSYFPRPIPQGFPYGSNGNAGTANTGGGGGGAGGYAYTLGSGGSGGSGVVIVRFPTTYFKT